MAVVQTLARGKLHYGWVVVGIAVLTLLITAAAARSVSVMIVPIEHEFGWSRATISAAISVNLCLFGLMGPFSAAVIEWLNPQLIRPEHVDGRPTRFLRRALATQGHSDSGSFRS